MAGASRDRLYSTALQTIGTVSRLPVVRVDRETFLRKQFRDSPHLEVILREGPPAVYTAESLRRKADASIRASVAKTSMASFVTGLPANPALMAAAGGADVAQYFGFALNLAQQIAYLFGEDDLFDADSTLSEAAEVRVIAYLGAMFGAAGAATLIAQTSRTAGQALGRRVARQALTTTTWYPLVKKVGALLGKRITRRTVEKTVTKSVPVIGGVVSGGLTYVTFRPLGGRLADAFVAHLNGEFDDHLELNPAFAAAALAADDDVVVVEAVEVVEVELEPSDQRDDRS